MSASRQSYRAFVSSTFEDLKKHRAHLIHALRKAGFVVDPMEDWTADTDEPKQFSQERVDGCDLCILLLGLRRGHIPKGESLSITQLEYQAALSLDIDVLVFMLREDAAWPRTFDELDKDSGIRKWREELAEKKGVGFFDDKPATLEIAPALTRWVAKQTSSPDAQAKAEKVKWPAHKSPYPGLMWFDEGYAPLFFGRDREVNEVIAKMSEPEGRFVIISGASGSGKSSLVGAGAWHALIEDDRIPGSSDWIWLRIVPGDGKTPFASLAWRLKQQFSKIKTRPDKLADNLARNERELCDLLATHLHPDQDLVLFVDQLEELFTRRFDDHDIRLFLERLVATAHDKKNRLHVLTTVRSEFLGRLEESEAILGLLNAGYNYHLGPLSPRALQDMIEKPAQATGYEFEPNLVTDILQEARQEPGHLPLVAFALNQLFERRDKRQFTRTAYKEIRGLGAIGTLADQVIEGLDEAVLDAFDRVFSKLVHVEHDGPATRRRVLLREFDADPAGQKLIEALAATDCRVLVTDEAYKDPTVEVAHEKLFAAWERLRHWSEGAGDALRLIEHAQDEAATWAKRGQQLEELWSKDRLAEVVVALKRFGRTADAALDRFLHPQGCLIELLNEDGLTHEQRAHIGKQLAEFGDRRPGVGLREDGLPDILWSDRILPGEVEIEDIGPMAVAKPFRIAIYPVTEMQFEAFVKDPDGYEKLEAGGPEWRSWATVTNDPQANVSWFEAVAFCRWLTQKYWDAGLIKQTEAIRLPTEWEWQLAATGGDPNRVYPWGDWDEARCNSRESGLVGQTAVGIYPGGASPYRVLDMAGNVWEWCLNKHENPRNPSATAIDPSGERAMRGGSSDNEPGSMRSSRRARNDPDVCVLTVGFRLALDIE